MKRYLQGIVLTSLFLCILFLSSYFLDIKKGDQRISRGINTHVDVGSLPQTSCISNPNIQFFMYHYIRDHEEKETATTHELSVAPALFEEHMKVIRNMVTQGDITLMKGDDFLHAFDTKCFPGKDIWIFTADDGWIDMRDALLPIAMKYRVPFFLGIITGKFGQNGFLSMSDVQNISKNSLMTISSHSVNHVNNAKLDGTGETIEMCNSKNILEKITGLPVLTYIYPSGRIDPTIDIEVAKKCGYKLAWSTSFGSDYNDHTGSIYDLNRVRIHADTSPDFFQKYYKKIHAIHASTGSTVSNEKVITIGK